MGFFKNFIDLFYNHVVVVNEDPEILQKEVQILQKKCGPWHRICGFANYKDLFLAMQMAKAKHRPFTMAFVKETEFPAEFILKRVCPDMKLYKYSTIDDLEMLPVFR